MTDSKTSGAVAAPIEPMIGGSSRPFRRDACPAAACRGGARIVLATLVLVLVCIGDARAQGGAKNDNVLYPHPEPIPLYVGPEAGIGNWTHKGGFTVPDGPFSCAAFNDGSGRGITLGLKSFIYLNRWFFISPRLRREPRPAQFTTDLEGEPVRLPNDSIAILPERGTVDASFGAVTLDVTVGVEFFKTGLYLFGGAGGSYLMDGVYDYSEEIVAPSPFVYSDLGRTSHTLVSGRSFPTYQKTSFDLRGGAGFILRIGRLAFNPEVFLTRPMTAVMASPDEIRQQGIIGTFSIMYNLGN